MAGAAEVSPDKLLETLSPTCGAAESPSYFVIQKNFSQRLRTSHMLRGGAGPAMGLVALPVGSGGFLTFSAEMSYGATTRQGANSTPPLQRALRVGVGSIVSCMRLPDEFRPPLPENRLTDEYHTRFERCQQLFSSLVDHCSVCLLTCESRW